MTRNWLLAPSFAGLTLVVASGLAILLSGPDPADLLDTFIAVGVGLTVLGLGLVGVYAAIRFVVWAAHDQARRR